MNSVADDRLDLRMDGRREIVVEEVRDVSSLFRSTSAMFLVAHFQRTLSTLPF
jgi:hypothetical protein